jgi:Family of unknown function (DUF6191)
VSTVELVLSLSIPGVVVLMVAVGVYELVRQRRRKRVGTPVTATYLNEFTAMFYGTKRVELDNRDSTSMLREEDAQGAPPWLDVDLDRGIVVLRPESRGPSD